MTTKLHVANPDDIEFELTVKMTLKQWRRLREQLPSEWPSIDLTNVIFDMILQAEKTFYPEEKKP